MSVVSILIVGGDLVGGEMTETAKHNVLCAYLPLPFLFFVQLGGTSTNRDANTISESIFTKYGFD